MGTLALITLDKFLMSGSASNLATKCSKKCVYLFMKFGQTQIKSISLLFDFRSRTYEPKGNSFAV